MIRPSFLVLALASCTVRPSIIGETAESTGEGGGTGTSGPDDGESTTDEAASEETMAMPEDSDTASAPDDCEAPCVWTVVLESMEPARLALDGDGLPIVVTHSNDHWFAHHFDGDGGLVGPPAALADVPTPMALLQSIAVAPDGALVTAWYRDSGAFDLQRRSPDLHTAQWSVARGSDVADGPESEALHALDVAADGSIRIVSQTDADSTLRLSTYDPDGALAWDDNLGMHGHYSLGVAAGPDDSTLVWGMNQLSPRMQVWQRHANGDVDERDVYIPDDVMFVPLRRTDGWVTVANAGADGPRGVGVWFIDDALELQHETDWPAPGALDMQPRRHVLVGDRTVVFVLVGYEPASLELRTYGPDGVLEDVAELAAAGEAGAIDGDVYQAVAAPDDSVYVLGSDRDPHGDFVWWLRKFAI